MKPVHTWNDLEQFGINCLTGEACAYSQRLLCDVNDDGAKLMADYLGIDFRGFADNWNSQVNGKPAVGSVMLHRDSLQQVAVFAMFRAGALAVYTAGGDLTPICDSERMQQYVSYMNSASTIESVRLFRNPTTSSIAPREGSRNVHAATGRTT